MKILTMDDFLKRIQSRLKYNGITASKAECREAYCQFIPQEDWNNPSADQILLVVQRLTEWDENNESDTDTVHQETSYSQAIQEPLVSVSEFSKVSEDLSKQIPQPETIEITPSNHPDIWETLQQPQEELSTEQISLIAPEHQLVNEPESLSQAPLVKTDSQAGNFSLQPNSLPIQQSTSQISQIEVTQAITQAIQQVGEQGNAEAVELLTSLANELTDDIKDTQEMVTALVTAYLGKRQVLLSSAIGTLNTLRSAQTESFQAGLDQDFFGQKQKNKEAFLSSLNAMFN